MTIRIMYPHDSIVSHARNLFPVTSCVFIIIDQNGNPRLPLIAETTMVDISKSHIYFPFFFINKTRKVAFLLCKSAFVCVRSIDYDITTLFPVAPSSPLSLRVHRPHPIRVPAALPYGDVRGLPVYRRSAFGCPAVPRPYPGCLMTAGCCPFDHNSTRSACTVKSYVRDR